MAVYRLPERMRARLARPLGRLYVTSELRGGAFESLVRGARTVITVGDRTTETVWSLGKAPDVQVVDGKEERRGRGPPAVPSLTTIRVHNPAGTLTTEAIGAVRAAFERPKPVRVLIEGEEDLVALPVIALAPASALVLYGQPGVGVVTVRVDAAARRRSKDVMRAMGVQPAETRAGPSRRRGRSSGA